MFRWGSAKRNSRRARGYVGGRSGAVEFRQADRLFVDHALAHLEAAGSGRYFMLWLANGEPFSPSAMQGLRDDAIERLDSRKRSRYAQVHPYVGYVEDPRTSLGIQRLRRRELVPISDYGYYDDKPPIQQRGPDRVVIGITGGSVACYFAINGTKRLAEELRATSGLPGRSWSS